MPLELKIDTRLFELEMAALTDTESERLWRRCGGNVSELIEVYEIPEASRAGEIVFGLRLKRE